MAYMKTNIQERTGIITTRLTKRIFVLLKRRDKMTQQRQKKPADEW